MSALALQAPDVQGRTDARVARVQLALLGTGTVGSAVLARLAAWSQAGTDQALALVHAANSRCSVTSPFGIVPEEPSRLFGEETSTSDLDAVAAAFRGDGPRIVVDATASDAVADRHAQWLSRGIHVVTACKLGQGASLARWRAIRAACARSGARYGDSATVGAGLPLLRSLRALRRGGDRIHGIAGVLSGSLAWLFHRYDGVLDDGMPDNGRRPFSALVRQAREAGYTEPDPREDLSGEDVRRKLLILARAAGFELESDAVEVGSLVPRALAEASRDAIDALLPTLDAPLRARHADAHKRGAKLHFVARLAHGRARVGIEALSPDDPLAGGSGTDNRVAIWSDRYARQPLVIQGPGAGADVTAAALLDDVLAIAENTALVVHAA